MYINFGMLNALYFFLNIIWKKNNTTPISMQNIAYEVFHDNELI